MSHRTFDADGVSWTVWSVSPTDPNVVDEPMRFGWLCFEANGVKRRVCPIPYGWESLDDQGLRSLLSHAEEDCQTATPVDGARLRLWR